LSEFKIRHRKKGVSGIYKITSPSGRVYIGSSRDIRARALRHRSYLTTGTHPNRKMQNSFNKYGELTFDKIYECPPKDLEMWEQIFIDKLKPSLNILQIAYSSKGFKHSDEMKKKIGAQVRARLKKHNHLAPYNFKKGEQNPNKKGKMNKGIEKTSKPIIVKREGSKDQHFRSVSACARVFKLHRKAISRRLEGFKNGALKGWQVEYA